jgi:hypothetical protein
MLSRMRVRLHQSLMLSRQSGKKIGTQPWQRLIELLKRLKGLPSVRRLADEMADNG